MGSHNKPIRQALEEVNGKPARIHLKFIPEQMNSAMLNQSLQVKHRFSLWGFLKPLVETGGLW